MHCDGARYGQCTLKPAQHVDQEQRFSGSVDRIYCTAMSCNMHNTGTTCQLTFRGPSSFHGHYDYNALPPAPPTENTDHIGVAFAFA
jgi:hypothetical protein